jgi:hypothetical protein
MNAPVAWQKSSYSQEGGDCVEVAATGSALKLREGDEPHAVLTTSRTRLSSLLIHIKEGRLDRLVQEI